MGAKKSAAGDNLWHWVCEQCGDSDGFWQSEKKAKEDLKAHKEKDCDAQNI